MPTRLNDYLLEVGKSSGEKAISIRKRDLFYDLKSIWCQLSVWAEITEIVKKHGNEYIPYLAL